MDLKDLLQQKQIVNGRDRLSLLPLVDRLRSRKAKQILSISLVLYKTEELMNSF